MDTLWINGHELPLEEPREKPVTIIHPLVLLDIDGRRHLVVTPVYYRS
jgi:hypothetical protein